MENKLKIKILKGALQVIRNNVGVGMCYAINLQPASYDGTGITHLLDYDIRKPKEAGNYFWFPLNEEGQKKRIKILTTTIKRLEK